MQISFKTLEENLTLRQALKDEGVPNDKIREVMKSRVKNRSNNVNDSTTPRSKITPEEIEDAEAIFGQPTRQFMREAIKDDIYEDIIEALGLDPKEYPKEIWEEERKNGCSGQA